MKTVQAAKLAAQLNEYLDAAEEQPVLIMRNGKPVAVLLAVRDKAEAEQLAGNRPRSLRSILEEAHRQFKEGGGIPEDQFWREVEEARCSKRPQTSRGTRSARPGARRRANG
jgi:prevent-host-death family protein